VDKRPLFTVILDTYYRPKLLKEAVEAIRRQTYDNLEIILINNGATAETVKYLYSVAGIDKRIKLIHFAENQYHPDDPLRMLDVCLNAGLNEAKGDYIFYQSDDDWMCDDYVEKMVSLFLGHSECTTAAGLPVAVDEHGSIISTVERKNNLRSRYMLGHEVALDKLRGGSLFSAPGSIFSIKTDVLRESGGFHRNIDKSHLYGIVPFGVTGFDETAVFHWRRHAGQLNIQLADSGKIWLKDLENWLSDWEIECKWQIFGSTTAYEVVNRLIQMQIRSTAIWFVLHLLRGRLKVCKTMWRQIGQSGHTYKFLAKIPGAFWLRRHDWFFLPKVFLKRAFGILLTIIL
jgi:glycosyltransferase involved in cell wall biosynthesis